MKFVQLIFLTQCLIVLCLASSTRKRIKLTVKGVYPDNPDYHSLGSNTDQKELMNGWRSSPKISKQKKVILKEKNETKEGSCGNLDNYGVLCTGKMDQCTKDMDCPGVAKCCLVSKCGLLCVKPKDKSQTKKVIKKRLTTEDDSLPAITNGQGLKIRDITYV